LNFVDWREIIYQMAKDFYANNTKDDFELTLAQNNENFYPSGQTGYEQYYIDLLGFWRQLYDPNDTSTDFYQDGEKKSWNKKVYESPETLNFWFDFLDVEGELS
jgi:hypothetical protein